MTWENQGGIEPVQCNIKMKNVESMKLQEKVEMTKINKYLPHCNKNIVLIFQTLVFVHLETCCAKYIYQPLLIDMIYNIQLSSYPAQWFECIMTSYMSNLYYM